MSIIGDIGGFVGDIVGGHLNRKSVRAQQDQSDAMQREFAQMGVRWKVADAKAAGVHPLFALGAQTQGYTPSGVVSDSYSELGRAGQHLGNAVGKAMDLEQKMLAKAQLRAMEAETNSSDAQASMYRSQAMLNLRDLGPSFPPVAPDIIVDPLSGAHIRRLKEEDITGEELSPIRLHNRSGGEALQQGWTDYNFGNGAVTLFRGDPDQLMSDLQDMDTSTRAMILAENLKRGQGRAIRALFDMLGKRPTYGGSRDRNPQVGPGGGYLPRR